jgi:hypothetical protein
MSDKCLALLLHPKKHEAGGGLALHTCMCLEVLHIYVMVPYEKRGKLGAKEIECVFIGY